MNTDSKPATCQEVWDQAMDRSEELHRTLSKEQLEEIAARREQQMITLRGLDGRMVTDDWPES